ncbi:MAG: hypothetical protein ACOYXR_03545 [Nitrospirota bacterium]
MEEGPSRRMTERLERLERDARRFKILSVIALSGVVGVMALGAARPSAPPDEIRTRRLVVVDDHDAPRATLGLTRHGVAGLRLYDDQQQELISLEVLPGAVPSLTFFGPDGRTAAWLIAWPDVTTGLAFGDESGNAVALVTERDRMRLTLSDANGISRSEVIAGTNELPGLVLADAEGMPRAELSLNEDHDPQLLLGDQDGVDRARLALDQGEPTIELLDDMGMRTWGQP